MGRQIVVALDGCGRARRRVPLALGSGRLGPTLRQHGRAMYAKMRIAAVDGRLMRTRDVRLVFSKRPAASRKTMVAFATNETKLAARAIVSIYEKCWAIEVLFKELMGDLGPGDYQVLSKDAIQRHLHLCGLAHLLTRHSMDTAGAQARKANTEVPLPTMSERLAALRDRLRRDQIRQLFRGKRHDKLRQTIEQYPLAA